MMRMKQAASTRRVRLTRRLAGVAVLGVLLVGCDADKDLIPNSFEKLYGWDEKNPDEDGNGTLDGEQDHDGDGLSTHFEVVTYPKTRDDGTALDPTDDDSDNDDLTDGEELGRSGRSDYITDPLAYDTDEDGLFDGREVLYVWQCPECWPKGTDPTKADTDNDDYGDLEEINHETNPRDGDTDGDGLGDGEEVLTYKTDPFRPDTDDDNVDDYDEVITYKTNPFSNDTDEDNLFDGVEIFDYGTDPLWRDTDSDGWDDYDELDAGTDPLDHSSHP